MTIQDVINLARFGELSGVNIKDNDTALVAFINMGMIEIYKRFTLKMEEHIVPLVEGQTLYALPDDFMYPYSAHKEVEIGSIKRDEEVPINDEDEPLSIFFPNHREVQIPAGVTGGFISIIYVAKPEKYSETNVEAELDLPDALIDCLLHYIGYRAYLGIRTDGQAANNAHYSRFERSVAKAKELGVAPSTDTYRMIDRLADRGFV